MSAKKDFLSYPDARTRVVALGIVTKEEYIARFKAGDLGEGRPSSPFYSYKGKGWESWGAFLGKKAKVAFIAYDQAHQHILSLNLPNRKAYWDLRASGELGEEYPSLPECTYEGQGWVDWGTFLGTGYVAAKNRQFLSFEHASQWCQKAKIKGAQDYFARFAKREMPDFLPQSPQESYAGKGWTTWGEFY